MMLGILEQFTICLFVSKQLKHPIRMHITACWSEAVYQFINYQMAIFLCHRSNIKSVVLFISLDHECISHLTLWPIWEIFHAFLSSADFFFKINFFRKILSGIPSECQTDWIRIRPDILFVKIMSKRHK